MENILAVIPARSGSKGVQNKNIRFLGGHPLMAWSIKTALERDNFMTADSAKSFGLIDEVVEKRS